ncbi:baseplate J/gp47 family protein [Clostridium botulinum]|uniref:baseplate J/gp47 family protein n=1 Tax=Clostridium botulinum TaxID=1491 RepID=UPI00249DE3E5|nr:baseplate J/gp47 family protein [Clostridium botulinum]MDU4596434.1 baseplate J/gp47 family protein [Clostridium sporogenes]WGZ48072.1 baseplate J/gp47 family protein [Clostridium botulinum]
MFNNYTKESDEEICEKMKNSISDDIDKSEGSFTHDVLSPTSQQIFQNRMKLNEILNLVFIQTSYDEWLEMGGESRGVPKNQGKKATGKVSFKGKDFTSIKKNSLVQTAQGLQYITLQDGVILEGKVVIPVQAVDIGKQYNIPSNTIVELPISIPGVLGITNEESVQGGADKETNDEYRKRILQRVQNPPSSGNKSDYERWAKEIDGVKGVKPIPLWDGPGTVKIIIYGDNGTALDNKIIQNVKTYIDPNDGDGEGKAPIGATVTVTTVTNKILNIAILGIDTDDIQTTKINIKENLQKYLETIKPGNFVKIINIIGIIATTEGVKDFKDITLNGKRENITTTDEEKVILGEVSYEEL